jgi:hypothetical protein
VLYGALLRFDALVGEYGIVRGSPGVEAMESIASALARSVKPSAFVWKPAGELHGDPKSYLKIARTPQGFYEASAREPLFLATIRGFLWVSGGQDIAVNCASLAYSILLVLATYLLGAAVSSRGVGLAAATLLAVEAWAVRQGVAGWRDDAFAFFTVMTAFALVRLSRRPSMARACATGAWAAGACLIRVSALSFVIPAFVYASIDGPRSGWRSRASHAVLALSVALLLVGPFLVNNAIKFGDPFYSVDFATEFYRGRAEAPVELPLAWGSSFLERIKGQPLTTVDSLGRGLTTYPIVDKWHGYAYLSHSFAAFLQAAAVAGVVVLLTFADGRIMLVVLFAALLPFAAIWETRTGSQWRFTLFAYPFYLIAACHLIRALLSLVFAESRHRLGHLVCSHPKRWAALAFLALALLAAVPEGRRAWYYLLLREAAATQGAYSVVTGGGDGWFFGNGWHAPATAGKVTGRYSRGPVATMWIPGFASGISAMTFRMQACSADATPKRDVHATVNGVEVGILPVVWDSERAREYEVRVPAEVPSLGWNRVDLTADGSTVLEGGESCALGATPGQDIAFFLWYVRVVSKSQ